MKKIPLFILAGLDNGDNFGRKRLFELKINNQLILEYLVEQAQKSECFSDIYLITSKKLKDKFSSACFFIEAKNKLWRNLRLIYNFVRNRYRDDKTQIAILISDVLPAADDFKEIFQHCRNFLEQDAILLGTPTHKPRKKRESHFLKKELASTVQEFSGTGALYIFRPFHLKEKLIYFLASTRMPRKFRKIEITSKKPFLRVVRVVENLGDLFVLGCYILKFIFLAPFYFRDFILAIKTFIKHQKRELIIKDLEMVLTVIFVKRKYRQKNISSIHIEIVENPVFVEDIDREEDLKILEIKKPQ